MIAIQCPKCQTAAELADHLAGSWHRCGQCKAPIKVPGRAGGTAVVAAQGPGETSNPFSFDFAGKAKGSTKVVPALARSGQTTTELPPPPPIRRAQPQVVQSFSATATPPPERAAVAVVPMPPAVQAPAISTRPCPNCHSPIPTQEFLCTACGLDLKTGKKTGLGTNAEKSDEGRTDDWLAERRKAKEVFPMSYVTAAFSGTVIASTLFSVFSAIGAIGISAILGFLLGMLTAGAGGPFITLPIAILAWGIVFRYPLAMCEAEAAGKDHAGYERWGFMKCGLCCLALNIIVFGPAVLALLLIHPLLFYPCALLGYIYLPMAWLRIAVLGGEGFHSFNPIEVFKWIAAAAVPYLGVLGLLAIESVLITGAVMLYFFLLVGAMFMSGPDGFVQTGVMGYLGGIFIACMLSLHYLSYMFCMMGMLYRKHGKNMPL